MNRNIWSGSMVCDGLMWSVNRIMIFDHLHSKSILFRIEWKYFMLQIAHSENENKLKNVIMQITPSMRGVHHWMVCHFRVILLCNIQFTIRNNVLFIPCVITSNTCGQYRTRKSIMNSNPNSTLTPIKWIIQRHRKIFFLQLQTFRLVSSSFAGFPLLHQLLHS